MRRIITAGRNYEIKKHGQDIFRPNPSNLRNRQKGKNISDAKEKTCKSVLFAEFDWKPNFEK